jgi:hypothetical protein
MLPELAKLTSTNGNNCAAMKGGQSFFGSCKKNLSPYKSHGTQELFAGMSVVRKYVDDTGPKINPEAAMGKLKGKDHFICCFDMVVVTFVERDCTRRLAPCVHRWLHVLQCLVHPRSTV